MEKIDWEAIGARIRKARKTAELTGDQLGERVGVSKGAVSQWETGIARPPVESIIALCVASPDNSADEILLGEQSVVLDYFEREIIGFYRELKSHPEFQEALQQEANKLWRLANPGKKGPAAPFKLHHIDPSGARTLHSSTAEYRITKTKDRQK